MSHFRRRPSRADRLYSDLGQPEHIASQWLQDFTQAAPDASIPIILGGHSVASGGMLAPGEAAKA